MLLTALVAVLLPLTQGALLPKPLGRRAIVTGAIAVGFQATPSHAGAPAVRVSTWPSVEYLEPIYELKLSLDALQAAASNSDRWPALRKRLEIFCGGPLSEQYYFPGLSQQYVSKIMYDDLDEFVRTDKRERQERMEGIMAALRRTRDELRVPEPNAGEIAANTRAATKSMSQWLAMVPEADVRRAAELFANVRAADSDRNGKLSAAELETLNPSDKALWKAKVALVGE